MCVPPEPPCDGEGVGRGDFEAVGEGLGVAECRGVAFGVAEWVGALDGVDPPACPLACPDGEDEPDEPDALDMAVTEPLAAALGPVEDPLAAHAVRPAPAAKTAMITAGIRRILMFLSSVSNQTLHIVTTRA